MFPSFFFLGKEIGLYSVCAFLGLIVCGAVGYFLGKKHKILFADIVLVMLSIGTGMVIGGHLLYSFTQTDIIIDYFNTFNRITLNGIIVTFMNAFGGSVFYGGLFGSIIAICIHTKISKTLSRNIILDIFAVTAPLFHVFGRIGCFLGGCCFGIESKFGFTAHGNVFVPEINDISRFPVQLLEAFLNLLIFIILIILYKKSKKNGKLIYTYLLLYSPVRFVLEFLRGDLYRGFLFGLSTSQWISIMTFIVVLIIQSNSIKRYKKIKV